MKKRFLSILTTLCLCLTLLPATAMAESGSIDQAKFVVTNWGALQTNLENSTKEVIDATLEKDITWGGSSLTVPEGKNVTIKLNAHSIDAQYQGTVIKVYGTLTLENTGDIGLGGGPGSGAASGCLMNGTSGENGGAGGILIADGGRRKYDSPKKKKVKHLQPYNRINKTIAEKIDSGQRVENIDLQRELEKSGAIQLAIANQEEMENYG